MRNHCDLGDESSMAALIQVAFGSMTKHVLIAVPLFIFTGMAMLRGGAAARLVHYAATVVGR